MNSGIKLLLLVISLLSSALSFGQQSSLTVAQIDSVAAQIDSVKDLSITIVDGQFRPKGKGKWAGYRQLVLI